jgi:EAL domain-containing protein (putative c-di-GMP-specific phosphodiesterase class I)/GGDEF domain-containing protein
MNIMQRILERLPTFLTGRAKSLPLTVLFKRLERDLPSQNRSAAVALLHISLSRSDGIEALLGKANCAQVEQELLRRIRMSLHKQDYFSFTSRNEIWVALPQLPSKAIARLAASNLIQTLETPITYLKSTVTIRPVIGIAIADQPNASALNLLKAAINAENRARSLSQRYWFAAGNEGCDSKAELIAKVQYALMHNELSISYQPKVDLNTGRIVGVEVLVRWAGDNRSYTIEPSILIDIAEQNGMIQDLTRFILNTALREYVATLADLELGKIWVNLSASMLRDPRLGEWLQQIVDVWGVKPQQIGFEVTESTLLTDVEQSIATLHGLADIGFSIAIDDFGTGYSSLLYLRRFPVCELKIDKVFVQHMSTSVSDCQIVRTIIALAHNFQLAVVAEGAEDEATLSLLKDMQCDQVQGYIFAKAMPAAELVSWVDNYKNSANAVSH